MIQLILQNSPKSMRNFLGYLSELAGEAVLAFWLVESRVHP